ncbi:helix-turn-helix protein [Actinomadura pelletieri DSM 43383]|uniref:Helix-turn-helix protein n=1 Tax=Actinomadura pelletieri DSM 43383 TaxID=1120940 RepID=A0A495QXL7_9ACTN|nr:helix-turn-helix transcriptional regulator [Actinomadura pelletieri]RKS78931.1 helix-turn-helix protein [Actinomadura pelletieri DSM 43383]
MDAVQPEGIPAPGRRVHDLADSGPTVLRILLGGQLRRLREARGITPKDAGDAIRASASKISRLELGRVGFKKRDVADLLTLYGVLAEEEREPLLSLAERANRPGWWQRYSDILPPWFEVYIGLEEAASALRVHETRFVPELLQTPDYARAAFGLDRPMASETEIERRVNVLVRRQRILRRETPPQLWALVDESALRRPLGDREIMRAQLTALLDAIRGTDVTLQIVPPSRGALAAMAGPFTMLRFAEPSLPDVVYMEQLTSALYLDKDADLAVYKRHLDRMSVNALPPAATEERLVALLDEVC